jgi:hypothetical protein
LGPNLDQAPERFEGEWEKLKVKRRLKSRSTEGLPNRRSLSLLYQNYKGESTYLYSDTDFLRIEATQVLNIPDVENTLTVSPLEAVGRQVDDFHHDEGAFPRGGELVHSLGGLDATQGQVSHVDGPLSHIAVMVAE